MTKAARPSWSNAIQDVGMLQLPVCDSKAGENGRHIAQMWENGERPFAASLLRCGCWCKQTKEMQDDGKHFGTTRKAGKATCHTTSWMGNDAQSCGQPRKQ